MSPLLVTIWLSSRNLQQLRYPVWPGSSRLTRTLPSRVFKLKMDQNCLKSKLTRANCAFKIAFVESPRSLNRHGCLPNLLAPRGS